MKSFQEISPTLPRLPLADQIGPNSHHWLTKVLARQAGWNVKTARATVLQDLTWLAYLYCSFNNIKNTHT